MELQRFLKETQNFEEISRILSESPYYVSVRLFKDDVYVLSFTDKSDTNGNIICRQCNGTFVDYKTNDIIHYFTEKAITFTPERFLEEVSKREYKIGKFLDGVLIKIYFHKGLWRTGTSKHPYAHLNRRNGKSFLDMFLDTVRDKHKFLDGLDKTKCYTYILQHRCCQTVYQYRCNKHFFINSVDLNTFEVFNRCIKFESNILLSSLVDKTANIDCLIFFKDPAGNEHTMKYTSSKYNAIKALRNNMPNIRLSFVSHLNNKENLEKIITSGFFILSDKMLDTFLNIEASYIKLIDFIFDVHYGKQTVTDARFIETLDKLDKDKKISSGEYLTKEDISKLLGNAFYLDELLKIFSKLE